MKKLEAAKKHHEEVEYHFNQGGLGGREIAVKAHSHRAYLLKLVEAYEAERKAQAEWIKRMGFETVSKSTTFHLTALLEQEDV